MLLNRMLLLTKDNDYDTIDLSFVKHLIFFHQTAKDGSNTDSHFDHI